MKTQFERIASTDDSSINILVNPNLSDFFYWHFHPEYELVFIDGASNTRHVGDHVSRFEQCDLVFIGSNIPHLNFDYGIKTDYEKIVIQLKPDFLQRAMVNIPELKSIHELFVLSVHGIGFSKDVIDELRPRLKKLHVLKSFDQFLELLSILHVLADSSGKQLLHESPYENRFRQKDQERMRRVYDFIEDHYQEKIEISEMAAISHLTNEAFCRYFKKMTKLTFTEFLNHFRIDKAKKLLLLDRNITQTCFESGFQSVSYFNRTFKKVTGENPLAFKKKAYTQNLSTAL